MERNEQIKKAVALAYDPDRHRAPQVVGKGLGRLADVIIDIARKADVHIHEDSALVGFLLALDIGEDIPDELFIAVAEVLAFVYELDKEKRGKVKK